MLKRNGEFVYSELNESAADTLLFIPDLNFELHFYREALVRLSSRFHVLALALPGSDGVTIPASFSKRTLGAYAVRFIRATGLDHQKFSVVVHGISNCVLNFVFAQLPHAVENALLVNPVVFTECGVELVVMQKKCCTSQVDVQTMESTFNQQNFRPKHALRPRDFAEKSAYYVARERFDGYMLQEFQEIQQFAYDRQMPLHVVFSGACKNMMFNAQRARELCPEARLIKGANYCFDEPEMASALDEICSAMPRSHIRGEVEISI